jgi:hypothetical protein
MIDARAIAAPVVSDADVEKAEGTRCADSGSQLGRATVWCLLTRMKCLCISDDQGGGKSPPAAGH